LLLDPPVLRELFDAVGEVTELPFVREGPWLPFSGYDRQRFCGLGLGLPAAAAVLPDASSANTAQTTTIRPRAQSG